MRRRLSLLLLLFIPVFLSAQGTLETEYEHSGFMRTPRYAETMDYCRKLADSSPLITMQSFGKSARGRDLTLMIVDRDGLSDPEKIREKGRIVVLIQACIHPGESEGKDAGMMLFRDLVFPNGAISPAVAGKILDRISILFIPIFNADGHERFGPYNRINQNGPEEMGWRVTANNFNLNRDFLKAEAPEMKAWLQLFNKWLPEFFIDSHTTDGADYQYALTYLIEIYGNMDEGLTQWSKDRFIPVMEKDLEKSGFLTFPYVGFRNWHDPRSGLIIEPGPPMLSQGYTAQRNRPGLLVETHMLKPYRTRVEATYHCFLSSLEILAEESTKLKELEKRADDFVSGPGFLQSPFPLQFQTFENDSVMVDFKGIEYTLVKSDISGGTWYNYGTKPELMKLPLFSKSQPVFSVNLPVAYIIPPEWESIINILELHGVRMSRLKEDQQVTVSTYRFRNPKWQVKPYEGRHLLTQFDYDESTTTRMFPAGSAVIEVSQQPARIIAHLLEPKGNGSLVSWGFFDIVFEQKEYAENYVLEKMAARMLADNPALKKEFEEKKASDTAFANSPQQILYWFYARSPYIDQQMNIYPVGRIMDREQLNVLKKQ